MSWGLRSYLSKTNSTIPSTILSNVLQSKASTVRYMVQQYITATGGQAVMNPLRSMYAIREVKISASDSRQGDESVNVRSTKESRGPMLW
ncbi:hypothetical protein U1Q18_026995 [Sarracenia purpurea var. burkii]